MQEEITLKDELDFAEKEGLVYSSKKEADKAAKKIEKEAEKEADIDLRLLKWVEESQFEYYMKDMTDLEKEQYIISEYRRSIPENMMWSNIIYHKFKENELKRKNKNV